MAVIGRIRKRVGLVIGFVGVSLVLFILGDLVTSNQGFMGRNSDVLGVIGGEKVRYVEFEKKVETLIENYKANSQKENLDQSTTDMLREQAWSMAINELTVGKEEEKLGITCSPEELYDMIAGKNPNQQVLQAFTDKNTGRFNPQDVIRFLKDLPNREEKIQIQWKGFEDNLREERIAEKYGSIMTAGIYATTAEAKQSYMDGGRQASIKYVKIDFSSIADSAVKVEPSDLKAYYNEHQSDFKQDQTVRRADYVTFDVKPSDEDKAAATAWINKMKEEFGTSTNDTQFVDQNSDVPFDSTLKAKGVLPPVLDTVVFDVPVGTMIGPYIDRESDKLAKLVAVKMVPDSVSARHILVKVQNNDTVPARHKIDSLKEVIKNGQRFDEIAAKFSEDQGSAVKGGELGWFRSGTMVPEFNNACFSGNKGDMPIVLSQFGYHLIEILDQGTKTKQVVVGIVERKQQPSTKTFDMIYQLAQQFAANTRTAEAFDNAVVKQGLNKRVADNVREADRNIAGLEQPREMIRWMYKAEKGDVSGVFTFNDKYVIAKLTDIKEKGILPMEAVMEPVKAGALKEKKAQMLMESTNSKIQGAKTIEDVATKLSQPVTNAESITFANSMIGGGGNEFLVVGTIFAMKAGQLSKPVKGENAIFVVAVDKFTDPPQTKDYTANQRQLIESRKGRVQSEVFSALKEKANIEDNRGKFY